MANPSISFTDRYSSTLQPLLLLSTDYLAIIIAEWCAVGGRDIVLELLGRKNDWFELNNFYFYLFVPLISWFSSIGAEPIFVCFLLER